MANLNSICRKAKIEENRKIAEAERQRLEQEDFSAALALQAQIEKEMAANSSFRQQIEQERQDWQLACKLAESSGQVDDSPFVR